MLLANIEFRKGLNCFSSIFNFNSGVVSDLISLYKSDWDEFEVSYDFDRPYFLGVGKRRKS